VSSFWFREDSYSGLELLLVEGKIQGRDNGMNYFSEEGKDVLI